MLLERIRVFKYLQVDSIDLGETCKLREKYGRKLNPSYLSNFRNGGSWKTNLNHQRRQPNAIPWPGT
jgi:hypothetical protein